MRRKDLIAIVVAGIVTNACATVAHGTHQTVKVTSDPVGATVTVASRNGGTDRTIAAGVTPLDVRISRRTAHLVVQFQMEGCAPLEVHPKRAVTGWIFMNLTALVGPPPDTGGVPAMIAGAVAHFVIDVATGGAYTFPSIVTAKLCEQKPSSPSASP